MAVPRKGKPCLAYEENLAAVSDAADAFIDLQVTGGGKFTKNGKKAILDLSGVTAGTIEGVYFLVNGVRILADVVVKNIRDEDEEGD